MRVALVHVRENYTPAPPMGIVSIGTVLKNAGHEVLVIDSFPAERAEDLTAVEAFKPDIAGLSVLTTQYGIAKEFTAELRRRLPGTLLCWGGIHATSLPEETLEDAGLDFVVAGEGEITMQEVCGRLSNGGDLKGVKGVVYKEKGEARVNAPRPLIQDLDSLPIPDRKLLGDYRWYLSPPGILRGSFYEGITTFYTSRGCPFACTFCSSNTLFGRKVRKRSVEHVMKEIEILVDEFGVKGLYFNDDTFGLDRKWLDKLCAALEQSGFGLVWGCQTRANVVTEEMLARMKKAGCVQVDIGSESGSDAILKTFKKGITTADIRNAFACIKKTGLKSCTTFILGAPGETREDIELTRTLAGELPSMVSFLILVPYPGSALYNEARDNDWFLDSHVQFDERWANKQSQDPVMAASTLPIQEVLGLRAGLERQFMLHNYMRILWPFFLNPKYLWEIGMTVLTNAWVLTKSLCSLIREGKTAFFPEKIYQLFNERMRRKYGRSALTSLTAGDCEPSAAGRAVQNQAVFGETVVK